jgi:hypothetical protein
VERIAEVKMRTYEELKAELVEISQIVEKFPVEVKQKVYDLLVSRFLGAPVPVSPVLGTGTGAGVGNEGKESTKKKSIRSSVGKGSARESYSIDKDLNLRGDKNKNILPFKSFYEAKKPGSAAEFNTMAVYYLNKLMGLPQVTLNHVYTCYAEVKKKPPEFFKQSFIDTKNKFGYVDFDDNGNLVIPHRGVVFVEHDLPPEEKKKKD